MKQYISLMKPGRENLYDDFFGNLNESEQAAFRGHIEYLKNQFSEGRIVFAGPSLEDHFAIVVMDAENKEQAEKMMGSDPAVVEGILTSKVSEFEVFLSK